MLSNNNRKYYIPFFLFFIFFYGCKKEEYIPKPEGQVRLEYPTPNYQLFSPENCPFEFEYSTLAKIQDRNKNCWYNINYPKMKGTVYLTYSPVTHNIYDLIKEAQKLVNEHKIKANSVKVKSFMYPEKKVYGNIYRLGGETASNIQFYVTDSTRNFLSGNVYFKVQPKPDSLQPAIEYIEKDVIRMIETTTWK
ncbi:gliding motility lipoprotein GldD [Apibacter raozihei]|uniref:gliding motility lipoprotein GldD n=1 Tax=Apibacter TaxID=1778601 RepID=UPI000FE443A1|nr:MULTISPECIES: gliding motility lipoprotein GldD [Apibacter]